MREEVVLKEKDAHAIELATTLAERQGEVCVPLQTQDRLIGFILLGRKRNRDIFSTEDLRLPQDRLIGFILLGRKRNRDIFSAEDLRLLSTLGTEVAVALENARLCSELRASHIMLTRSDHLAAVGTLAAGIAHEIRQIIKEHGGSIDVESAVGHGTRVLARLPLTGLPSRAAIFNGATQEIPKNGISPAQESLPAAPSPFERPKETE